MISCPYRPQITCFKIWDVFILKEDLLPQFSSQWAVSHIQSSLNSLWHSWMACIGYSFSVILLSQSIILHPEYEGGALWGVNSVAQMFHELGHLLSTRVALWCQSVVISETCLMSQQTLQKLPVVPVVWARCWSGSRAQKTVKQVKRSEVHRWRWCLCPPLTIYP